MPDPQDHADLEAAGESKAEEAAEDEVLDIVTSAGPEGRTFKEGADASSEKSAENQPDEADPHVDKQLDHGLKETFPASDPVSINPGAN
jgi:hypothetical protein